MNVALVYPPRPHRWPKFDWVKSACIELGHCVRTVRTLDELRAADDECDLVLFEHKSAGIGPNAIRDYGPHHAVWVQWWFDLIQFHCERSFEEQHIWRTHSVAMRQMDLVLVKERDCVDDYRAHGVEAMYLDQGAPIDIDACDHAEQPEFDVLVFGSLAGHYRQRRQDVRALTAAGYRVAWAGDSGAHPDGVISLPWCHPRDLPALMSRAAVTLSVDVRHDVAGFHSDRDWLALGAGACVVRRQTPGVLGDAPLLHYRTHDELLGHVERLVGRYPQRQYIGNMARRYVFEKGHTYADRVRTICEFAESIRRGEYATQRRALSAV